MSAEAIFRSFHPEVLDAYQADQERYRAWHQKVGEFVKRYPDHKGLQTSWSGTYELTGLVGDAPPGEGWRKAERARTACWVPDKRTKLGKALAAEMGALQVKRVGVLPGMPRQVLGPGRMYTHGVDVMEGAVWVTWGCSADLLGDVDPALWTPARKSEYYAAEERHSDGKECGSGGG